MGTSVSKIVKVIEDGDQRQDKGGGDYGSMGEGRTLTRVRTRGYRQSGHDLRCNRLYLSMILWWLCSKVRVKREDESAEIRCKLVAWESEKGETERDADGWGDRGYRTE